MSKEILSLEPKALWQHFHELTQIPRPSKHEDKIQKFMYDFGKNLGLETLKDETGNIIIKKPATPGMENCKGVVLQAHLDMVPQKNKGSEHNFEQDPIQTYVKDGWVYARDTTLGADNGIGAAAIMNVLSATDLKHGPIEALFTCDEETGMTGAQELKPGILNGDILMNLDSEDEGELYVGCAGGIDAEAEYTYKTEKCPENHTGFALHVQGLQGGHSGMDIHKGKANANKLLVRFLKNNVTLNIRIAEIEGGSLRNAIPRDAMACIAVPTSKVSVFKEAITSFEKNLIKEYGEAEPSLSISLKTINTPEAVIALADAKKILNALLACPNGVERMSTAMEGLTETSCNMARIEIANGKMLVQALLRSSLEPAKEALVDKFNAVFENIGAQTSSFGSYPGWQPNMQSAILETMQQVYQKLYGKIPEIKAVHAGLECGLLGAVYPNWDMISLGPTIRNPHSPSERVNVETVGKFWEFLKASLKAIPTK